jgi:hypothetical protein
MCLSADVTVFCWGGSSAKFGAMNKHMREHLAEEETVLTPLLRDLFTPEEEAQAVAVSERCTFVSGSGCGERRRAQVPGLV